MLEQYIFNKISTDSTLQTLLNDGSGGVLLYPSVVPKGIDADAMVTFTRIGTSDVYPAAQSAVVQFNIFAKTHTAISTIAQALSDLFNEDNHQTDGGIQIVYSQRRSESDLGYDYDDKLYQREATYYFKIR